LIYLINFGKIFKVLILLLKTNSPPLGFCPHAQTFRCAIPTQNSCSKPLRKWKWYNIVCVRLKVDRSLMQIRGGGLLSLRRVIMCFSELPRQPVLGELSSRGS